MEQPGVAIQSVVGAVAVVLAMIFLQFIRVLVMQIVPEGFRMLREEMQNNNKHAEERHAQHIDIQRGIQATLSELVDERRVRDDARARQRQGDTGIQAERPRESS